MSLQFNNFTQNYNLMFCGLEERARFRKKTHRGQKWVGWDDFPAALSCEEL